MPATMALRTARIIPLVRGTHFRGHIQIGGEKFNYEVVFAEPVHRLHLAPGGGPMVSLAITKQGGGSVLLDREVYDFFVWALFNIALRFQRRALRAKAKGVRPHVTRAA